MSIADGKVCLSLEGGYDIGSLSSGAAACMKVLLGEEPEPLSYFNRQSKMGLTTKENVPLVCL